MIRIATGNNTLFRSSHHQDQSTRSTGTNHRGRDLKASPKVEDIFSNMTMWETPTFPPMEDRTIYEHSGGKRLIRTPSEQNHPIYTQEALIQQNSNRLPENAPSVQADAGQYFSRQPVSGNAVGSTQTHRRMLQTKQKRIPTSGLSWNHQAVLEAKFLLIVEPATIRIIQR